MAECIAAMEEALSAFAGGAYHQPPRMQIRPGEASTAMGLMPAFRHEGRRLWSVKDVLVAPGNRTRGLDSHQGAVLLHDGETGELLALVDATAITAIRTAAVSAVATRALARPDAARIAILGTGTQARSHIAAMRLIFPAAGIALWGRSPERAGALAAECGAEALDSAQAAAMDADVICTVTSSGEPVLQRNWVPSGCHLNAVGASRPSRRELSADLLAAAEFFVDSREQAHVECGEYLLALQEGAIGPDHIRAEIGEVLNGRAAGRSGKGAITIFKSLGMAIEDLAAAERAFDRARSLRCGTTVMW
jgi:ornithine cyclodeaminase